MVTSLLLPPCVHVHTCVHSCLCYYYSAVYDDKEIDEQFTLKKGDTVGLVTDYHSYWMVRWIHKYQSSYVSQTYHKICVEEDNSTAFGLIPQVLSAETEASTQWNIKPKQCEL